VRLGTEDAVDATGIEAQGPELALKGGYVIAPEHLTSVVQQALTKDPAGLDQSVPGLTTALSVNPQAPLLLKAPDGVFGGRAEDP
jgi:hypothetical protein